MPRLMPQSEGLPRALYRAEQVRGLDRAAIEGEGIPGAELMERAGAAAYRLLRARWPAARDVTVLCGVGNNAGDGYVVARLARADGLRVRVIQVGDPGRLRGDALAMAGAWRARGEEGIHSLSRAIAFWRAASSRPSCAMRLALASR